MALFTGSFENKLDRKGRVSLPALYRSQLPDGDDRLVYLYRSPNDQALEACDRTRMDMIADSLDDYDLYSEEEQQLSAAIIADARPLTLDSEGRLMLPPEFAAHAGIADRVAFVGRGRYFQIWNPESYAQYDQEMREKARGRPLRLRRAGPPPERPR